MTQTTRHKPLIKPDETAKLHSKLRKLNWRLNRLNEALRSAKHWMPAMMLKDRNADPKRVLANIRKVRAEVRAELQVFRKKHGDVLVNKRWTFTEAIQALATPTQAQGTCDPTAGIVHYPSEITEYVWEAARTADDNWTRGGTTWGLVKRGDLWPGDPTIDANLGEAEGFAFEAYCTHSGAFDDVFDIGLAIATSGFSLLLVDPDMWENFMFHGLCMRYTFPAPQCNVRLDWKTDAFAQLPTGVHVDAESGFLSLQFVTAQQSPAAGFPGKDNLSWLEAGPNQPPTHLWLDHTSPYRTGIMSRISGSMNVDRGQQSCVYIGLGIQSGVTDGDACTGDCTTYPGHLPENGLFYTQYSPLSFSYPPPQYSREPGVVWTMTPR